MGLMRDTSFWIQANASLEVARSQQDHSLIRRIGCEKLSMLVEDNDFDADLERIQSESEIDWLGYKKQNNTRKFFNHLLRAETDILINQGVPVDLAYEIISEARQLGYDFIFPENHEPDDLKQRIKLLKNLSCKPLKGQEGNDEEHISTATVTGLKGILVMCANIGVAGGGAVVGAIIAPPIGAAAGAIPGLLVGDSIGLGRGLLRKALRRWW